MSPPCHGGDRARGGTARERFLARLADPEVQARRVARLREAMKRPEVRARQSLAHRRRHATKLGIEVPAWVEAAGLALQFLTVALKHGEEDAALYCRALKAQARAPE